MLLNMNLNDSGFNNRIFHLESNVIHNLHNANESKKSESVKPSMEGLLDNRYRVLEELGKGSFGQVVKCVNIQNNMHVAIKLLNVTRNVNSIISEIDFLSYINANDNDNYFVKYYENFKADPYHGLVFELLGENLYDYLKRTNFIGMDFIQVRDISHQLGRALLKLFELNIIHCDIKPENIAFYPASNNNHHIKLIDFGSSCFNGKSIYRYIQSRFYRAPEVILGIGYDILIDIWSVGCVIVEIMTGTPLFPGNSEFEQLCFFQQYLGPIPEYIIFKSAKNSYFCRKDKLVLKPPEKATFLISKSIQDVVINSNCIKKYTYDNDFSKKNEVEFLVNLIIRILNYDPRKRIKPDQYVCHPFFFYRTVPPAMMVQNTHMNGNINNPFSQPSIIFRQPIHRPIINPIIHQSSIKPVYQPISNQYISYNPNPYVINYAYPVRVQVNQQPEIVMYSNPQDNPNVINHYIQTQGMCKCSDCSRVERNINYFISQHKDKINQLLY